jgi:hypothetical protein
MSKNTVANRNHTDVFFWRHLYKYTSRVYKIHFKFTQKEQCRTHLLVPDFLLLSLTIFARGVMYFTHEEQCGVHLLVADYFLLLLHIFPRLVMYYMPPTR